jgi:hypothetical protein
MHWMRKLEADRKLPIRYLMTKFRHRRSSPWQVFPAPQAGGVSSCSFPQSMGEIAVGDWEFSSRRALQAQDADSLN